MEKAKTHVLESLESQRLTAKEDKEYENWHDEAERLNDLKIRVNTLCWDSLEPNTTLEEAEAIAITIYTMLSEQNKFLPANSQ